MAKYFSRYEHINDYSIVMRDDEGFESTVETARTREAADKKAARWQAKEDKARAKANV